ncbi:MAG: rhomboid family intramembrane serine protease [Natronomonas sp.]
MVPDPVWYAVIIAGMAVSILGLYVLARPNGRWVRLLRERLVYGVPWGTLVVTGAVAAFYLFGQSGLQDPSDPVVIPFIAWSYLYPTGMLTAGFAHGSLNHVTGNLLGTLVFGSLAEYAWSHYPPGKHGLQRRSFRETPVGRIAVFVVGVLAVGVFSAVFGLGPVIGFSGVVFAFVGFAIVRFPIATVAAILVSRVVRLVHDAFRTPELAVRAGETTFSRPGWAEIAIQGHALGLFVGAALGIALLYHRGVRPKPEHVYLAVLVFAVDRGLWAIYLVEGSETFRLFRALGVAAVFLIAIIVAVGATASGRTAVSSIDLSRREAAFGTLLVVVGVLSLIAVPLNLFVVDDPEAGVTETETVEVRDYTVFYAEDIDHQFIPAISIPGAEEATPVNASGVIVVSEQRNIWWQQVSSNRLRVDGEATVRLGGVGWSETVAVTRTTWRVTGGNETYDVRLGAEDDRRIVFTSDAQTADAHVDGRNISVDPTADGFEVVVRNETAVERSGMPEDGEAVELAGVTLERSDRVLFAERGDTRFRVAQRSE